MAAHELSLHTWSPRPLAGVTRFRSLCSEQDFLLWAFKIHMPTMRNLSHRQLTQPVVVQLRTDLSLHQAGCRAFEGVGGRLGARVSGAERSQLPFCMSLKYLGSRTSEKVKNKILELLYSWTVSLPEEVKIAEAYQMLKKQGEHTPTPGYQEPETCHTCSLRGSVSKVTGLPLMSPTHNQQPAGLLCGYAQGQLE